MDSQPHSSDNPDEDTTTKLPEPLLPEGDVVVEDQNDEGDEGDDESSPNKKSGQTGRPTNTVVWENVKQEEYTKDDGTTMMRQTCIHCQRVNNARKPQTTWWALHLVDREKGCQKAPIAVRHAILNTTTSEQVRKAGMSLFGVSATGKRIMKRSTGQGQSPAGRKSLGKLLEDNIEVQELHDGMLSQTCRHCQRNRTCRQMLATVWSQHFVDISPKGCPDCPFYVRRAIAQESSSSAVRRLAESQGWFLNNGGDDDGDHKPRGRPSKRAKTGSGKFGHGGYGLSQKEANAISMKIMQFLAACGHNMLLVQSPIFLELLRALNEEYVRRHLSKADVFVNKWLPKLYQSVQQQLSALWNDQRKQQSMATLGLWDDMPKSFKGPPMKILTEGMTDKLAFWETISAGDDEGETADGLAQHISNHMVAKSGDEASVEATYGAVVTTKSELNDEVGKIIQQRFPKVFVNRCRQQSLQVMKESIFQVHEIAKVYSDAQFLAHIVLDHPHTSTFFATLASEKGGTMPIAAESQNFGPVHKLLESLCGSNKMNPEIFAAVVRDPQWIATSTEIMDAQLVQKFESLVLDVATFSKMYALCKLFAPLSAFSEHLNRSECRASWMYSLFEALLKDVSEWCEDEENKLALKTEETFNVVNNAVKCCWHGDGLNEPGLLTPQLVLAMLLDPTTCPSSDGLPAEWESESEKVLKRFYSGKELLDSNAELMQILDHQGKFGVQIERFREAVSTILPSLEGRSHTQRVIDRQLPARDTVPHLVWKLSLRSSFPLLSEVARRVLVMGTTSIDAAWTSKLEKALGSNGLTNRKKLMLLYCHINLRVMKNKNNGSGVEDIESFEEFISQALLDEPDIPPPPAVKVEEVVEPAPVVPPADSATGTSNSNSTEPLPLTDSPAPMLEDTEPTMLV